jgi:type IV pilus assembly protein PilC
MPVYRYTAEAADGQKVRGTIEASSPTSVKSALIGRELHDVSVREKKGLLSFELTRKKVPPVEIMNFSRQLGSFVKAGIPILEALDAMSEETGNSTFKSILVDVADSLRAGETLSGAIA